VYKTTYSKTLKIGQAEIGGKVTWRHDSDFPRDVELLREKHGHGPFIVTGTGQADRYTYYVYLIDHNGDEVAINSDFLIESHQGRFVKLHIGDANIGGKITWTNSKINPNCNIEGQLDHYIEKHGQGPFTIIAIDTPDENVWLIRFVDQHDNEVAINKDFFIQAH
jgi:hypothetical protein